MLSTGAGSGRLPPARHAPASLLAAGLARRPDGASGEPHAAEGGGDGGGGGTLTSPQTGHLGGMVRAGDDVAAVAAARRRRNQRRETRGRLSVTKPTGGVGGAARR